MIPVNERNSIFERNSKIIILVIVLISTIASDVLLTSAYSYYKNKQKKQKQRTLKEIRIENTVYHHTFKEYSNSSESLIFGDYTIFTNSLGFKDGSSRNILLQSENHRILFMGDSFTEGVALDYENTFVGMIDAELKKRKVEVLNAGRGSYSPIIYWRKIKYLIEDVGLKFDEVVVFIDIGDAKDEAVFYDLTDNLNVISRPNLNETLTDSQADQAYQGSPILFIKSFIALNTTVIYHVLNALYDSFGLGDEEGGDWATQLSFSEDKGKWTINKEAYNKFGKEGVVLMQIYMNRLLKLLRKHKIGLTIAVYPYPSQVWFEDIDSIHVNIWGKWSQDNNVKFLNYFPEFVSKGLLKSEKLQILKKYYFPGDVHFNKKGNEVLAQKFIEFYAN